MMGFLSAAGDVLGNLFGTSKAAEKMVDHLSNGLDKLVYTDEEKAEARAKARSEALRTYSRWLEATTGSRLARRFLAFAFTGPWVLETTAATVLRAVAPWAGDARAKLLADSADALWAAAMQNNLLVGTILAFYFGGPVVMDSMKGAIVRWSERKAGGA